MTIRREKRRRRGKIEKFHWNVKLMDVQSFVVWMERFLLKNLQCLWTTRARFPQIDLHELHWSAEAIERLMNKGLMNRTPHGNEIEHGRLVLRSSLSTVSGLWKILRHSLDVKHFQCRINFHQIKLCKVWNGSRDETQSLMWVANIEVEALLRDNDERVFPFHFSFCICAMYWIDKSVSIFLRFTFFFFHFYPSNMHSIFLRNNSNNAPESMQNSDCASSYHPKVYIFRMYFMRKARRRRNEQHRKSISRIYLETWLQINKMKSLCRTMYGCLYRQARAMKLTRCSFLFLSV